MSTEIRQTEVETMSVAGFKLDKTFTIANVIQIILLLGGLATIWLNGYLDRRDTKLMVVTLQSQVERMDANFKAQMEANSEYFQKQLDKMEENRAILIAKNDDRLSAIQSTVNAHENRLNVGDEREVSIRERISEIFDELRGISTYLRERDGRPPTMRSDEDGG